MKTLVVYFSYTGHTKMIAERVKEKLNCDILEIKTVVPYSNDYQAVVDDEQNGEKSKYLPEIQKIDIDLSQYDKIVVGTPVWWYRPVPAIRTFLTQNDLSNKTIFPFATNAGWLGRTLKEIKSLCPHSKVESGLNILFDEDLNNHEPITPIKKIDEWIETLK
jgi:flavodoxin